MQTLWMTMMIEMREKQMILTPQMKSRTRRKIEN